MTRFGWQSNYCEFEPLNSKRPSAVTWSSVHGQTLSMKTLKWRHNGHDGVSNYQPHDCLLSRLFRRKAKKTSKLRVTGLCGGIHRRLVNSPHKWPVTQKNDSIWWRHHEGLVHFRWQSVASWSFILNGVDCSEITNNLSWLSSKEIYSKVACQMVAISFRLQFVKGCVYVTRPWKAVCTFNVLRWNE